MSTPLRWGILGTGGIAETFVTDLRATGIEVVAVGSRSQESADAFGSRFDIAARHPTYEALVADPEVDAVYVATPHPMHAENALLAIDAGKHVLVEKPFTLNAAEATEVAEAARRAGVVVLEAMWTRFLPSMVRIREIIAAGTLGEVRTLLADHDQLLPSDPQHRINNPELGGGALLDLGVYPVSFAVDLFGAPSSVTARGDKTVTGVDRQVALILEHDGGALSVLHTALDTRGANTATIVGTEGRIEIDSVWYNQTSFTVYSGESGEVLERYDEKVVSRGMQFQAWELERVVRDGGRESPLLPLDESIAIMAVLDEARRQVGVVYPGE
ncbi:Gfo/Idh/MocA family oxidoreductase [Agreia sp. VKM Ac-1783]|uniref:Gfo/Idh/MocA family protein n=1 Tax=Agreia sp. VKM Ac-1783 TaxID=1938889 RepID=UPI000A2ACCD3|nr:Gfo/Idh/MocA family oxidoreductase [Agreia sp. VKM Ac-1783]SMQ60025.1 Predicted dehydrogenase [Agreia sp. VKM Ac-1783]